MSFFMLYGSTVLRLPLRSVGLVDSVSSNVSTGLKRVVLGAAKDTCTFYDAPLTGTDRGKAE